MAFSGHPIERLSSAQAPALNTFSADKWSIAPTMMGTDGTTSKKPLDGLLHVTPSKTNSSRALQKDGSLSKNACCGASGSFPEVVMLDGGHVGPPSECVGSPSTESCMREEFHFNPPVSMRALLTDLREHQEDILKRVLHQQQELQGQMSAMTSAFQATISSQAEVQRCLEDRMAELRKLLIDGQAPKESRWNKPLEMVQEVEKGDSSRKADDVTNQTTNLTSNGDFSRDVSGTASRSRRVRLKMEHGSHTAELVVQLKARLGVWLTSKQFELGVVSAILMNSLLMCWQSQFQGLEVGFNLEYPGQREKASDTWPTATTVFTVFDMLFDCLFLLEMVLKISCWRLRYFFKGRRADASFVDPESHFARRWGCACWHCLHRVHYWNLLDFFCVAAFVFSEISTRAAHGIVDPQLPRLLRCFRLGRLLRLLRYLEFLDHLYIMSTAISALKTVMTGGIALLTMILMTCDLMLVQFLHATYFNDVKAVDLTEEQLQRHHEMYAYFGTWTRCILSMFELTLANWPPIVRLLTEELSEWFALLCLLHKLTIGFAVIGVINGVILQETFKVAQSDDLIMFRQNNQAKKMLRNKLRALFYDLDDDGNGSLELEEIERIGELPEIKVWLSSLGIETDDLTTLFQLLDVSGDGHISCEDFLSRLPRIKGAARSLDVLALRSDLEAKPIEQISPKAREEYRSQHSSMSGKTSNRTLSKTLTLAHVLTKAEQDRRNECDAD